MIGPNKCHERSCIFYRGILQVDEQEIGEKHYCHAYPEGIPDDINSGEDLHTVVRDDQDNEIVFQAR